MLPIGQGTQPAPGRHEVHVWRYEDGAGTQTGHIAALHALLSPDERARCLQLRDEQRRRQFVIGRALCRQVLSLYGPVLPQDWRFALGRRGKPYIATPELPQPMWFSLSHADGVSICAVTGAGPEIGIDLERIASGRNSLEIAEQFFSDAESTALRNLHPAQQTEAFVRLWALKESYVKAREIGLADGLSGTTFDLSPPDEIGVIFAHGLRERAQDWHFRLLRLGIDRILAIAVRQPSVATLLLRTQNWHGL